MLLKTDLLRREGNLKKVIDIIMEYSTHFGKISNSEAKKAAFRDMKESKVKYSYISMQKAIVNLPVVGVRMGLFGL